MIKRYNHSMQWSEPTDEDFAVTEPCPDGPWVRYTDHEQAVAKARECLKEIIWAYESIMDSIGALSNPSDLEGYGLSDSDQERIIKAGPAAREALAALSPTASGK